MAPLREAGLHLNALAAATPGAGTGMTLFLNLLLMLLLQIETATASCSVALTENGEVLRIKELNERNRHAEVITLFIREVMQAAGKTYAMLDAVVVSSGPGSYTGLRIGVSTAKGICYAADKPLIAVGTLAAMAAGFALKYPHLCTPHTLLCPMIDARRMEVYTALYTTTGEQIQPVTAQVIDGDSFAAELTTHRIVFFGDGADKCKAVLEHQPNALFVSGFVNSASGLTALATERLARQQVEDVAYFEPYYLKEFIAGIKKPGN